MLIETEMYKTHLLSDVTRYFSFFTDAGNFGSNMGFAAILFGISAIFIKERSIRIYYAIIAVCSIYALFISGTRGALFVPIGGIILLTFLSKISSSWELQSSSDCFLCLFRPYLYR